MNRTIYLDNTLSIAKELLSIQFKILLSNTQYAQSLIISMITIWVSLIVLIYGLRFLIRAPIYLYKSVKNKNENQPFYLTKKTNWYMYIFFMILINFLFFYTLVIDQINEFFIPISKDYLLYRVTAETAIKFNVLAVVTFPIIRVIYTLIFNRHLEGMTIKKTGVVTVITVLVILILLYSYTGK